MEIGMRIDFHQERQAKLRLIAELERRGILREQCPVPDDHGGVLFWHYEVLVPQDLPDGLVDEYRRLGEIRW